MLNLGKSGSVIIGGCIGRCLRPFIPAALAQAAALCRLRASCAGRARIGGWPGTFASGSRTATFGTRPFRRNETHTQRRPGVRRRVALGRRRLKRTSVAKASIVEVSLVELDEQPTLDGVLPAQAASAEARARARIFETLQR